MKAVIAITSVYVCLIIIGLSGCTHNTTGDALWTNPKAINRLIKEKGAKTVLDEIYRDRVVWHKVIVGIRSGESEWFNVASELYNVSDAGASEEINFAIGNAIDTYPIEVLKLLKQGNVPALLAKQRYFDLSVCQGVDIDDTRYDSAELSLAEIEKRKEALNTVIDPQLKEERDACIQALEDSKPGILRFYGKADGASLQENRDTEGN